MKVPVEVLEQIMLKCDGGTLLAARKSCDLLRSIVDYLGEKTRIWEFCCQEEIPQEQLAEYLPLYSNYDKRKWALIYINWYCWENYSSSILEPILRHHQTKMASIAVYRDYIAIGSEDGRLKLFTSHWQPIFEYQIAAVKLTKITFITGIDYGDYPDKNDFLISLVIAFPKGISVFAFDGIRKNQYDFRDVKSHSIYGNCLCMESVGGRMNIIQITKEGPELLDYKELWFSRIYSPRCITSYNMWDQKCTFLIDSKVSTLYYKKPELTPMERMEPMMDVIFYSGLMLDRSTTKILRDNVILNIYKNADKSGSKSDFIEDYVEIVILGPGRTYSKKLFNMWEVLRSKITCTYLYGNSFVVGTDSGSVYFYTVSDWKNFDMKRYVNRQIVGKHPIIAIASKETESDRRFYVCSKFAVHEIIAWIPFGLSPYD